MTLQTDTYRRRCRGTARTVTFSLLAGLVALSSGCAVDEKKEVDQYRKVLDGANPAQVTYAPGEPLSLQAALLLANQHNERLALGGEDYLQALIDKDRAAAAFLPTVSLVPSYSKADSSDDRGNARGGGGVIVDPTDPNPDDPATPARGSTNATGDGRLDVPVNLRANVFNGFRDVANYRRAALDINRRRALLLDLKATVLLDVARTYYQVLRSERSVDVLRNSVIVQNERVRDIRGRQRAGVARPLDIAQTEAQAAATRVTLTAAESDVRNGRTLLAFLTNAPVSAAPLSDVMRVPDELLPPDEVLRQAQEERQDLAGARAGVLASTQNVQTVVGQYYPSVSVNFNYFLSRESSPADSDWNGLISASLPIFTGGIIHANVRTALSQLRQAKLDESLLRRQVEQDVLIAYENLAASRVRLTELAIQLDASQEALRQAEATYNAGLATNLERIAAQDRLLSSQLQLTSEQFDNKVFYLNLLRAAGKLIGPLPATATEGAPPSTQPTTRPTV